jgi:DNA-binding MarR family transcriptional regulator
MVRLKPPKSSKPPVLARKKRSEKKQPGDVDYEALFQFRYRLRMFLAFSDANAHNAGLTSQQYQALLAIKGRSGQKPVAVGELAQFLLIKHHTAVELVDRMVKLGLLQRATDANDNRRALVTVTKKGFSRLQKVAAINFRHLGSSSLTLSKVSRLLFSGSQTG